jgi:hypothetical protein
LFVALFAGPKAVLAQPSDAPPPAAPPAKSEPGLTTVDPRAHGLLGPEAKPETPAARDSRRVFEAFRYHADASRATRYAGAGSALVVGGAMIATGLMAEQKWDETYGTVLWISGTVFAVGGALSLVFQTEAERMADAYGVYATSNPTPELEATLEREWATAARKASTARHIGAGASFVLAAASVGTGIGILASDMETDDRRVWGSVLFVGGGLFASGGIAALAIETPIEASYGAFIAARGPAPNSPSSFAPAWRVGGAPLPGGGFVGIETAF